MKYRQVKDKTILRLSLLFITENYDLGTYIKMGRQAFYDNETKSCDTV